MTLDKLKLKLLGNIQIFFNDTNITPLLSGKSIALLAYLSFYREIKHKRNKIVYFLWGNSEDKSAKYNLRYNLWSINKIIKDQSLEKLIDSEGKELYINSKIDIELDTDNLLKIEKDLNSGEYKIEDIILEKEKYRELFLEGIYIKECFEFNDWVYNKREEFQKIYISMIKVLLEHYQLNNMYNDSIKILKELINLNPYNEENYIQIIKGFLALNDKKNALLYYNKCINIFREELNTSPTEFLLEWKEIIKESSIPKNIKNCKINIFLKEDDEKTILNIECFPSRIEYSFLYELSDILIKNMEIKDKSLLKEISYINSETGIQDDFYYPDSEIYKIRLFNSFIKLLNIFSEKNGFFLVIKNFHFIDKISFDFFKYLVFSNKIEGNIHLISTLNCEELSYIEKYTIIHKN